MKIRENIPISTLTTMRLGGPARYVVEVEKPEEIPEAYNFAKSKNLPTFILGGGANTIGHDEGFNGVIIKSAIMGIESGRVTVAEGDPHGVYDMGEDSDRQDPPGILLNLPSSRSLAKSSKLHQNSAPSKSTASAPTNSPAKTKTSKFPPAKSLSTI